MSLAGLEGTCEGGGEEVAGSNEPDKDRYVEPDEDKVDGRGSSGRGPESRNCVMFEQWLLLDGRLLEQVVPVLVHEQDLHFPAALQRQQTVIMRSSVTSILYTDIYDLIVVSSLV